MSQASKGGRERKALLYQYSVEKKGPFLKCSPKHPEDGNCLSKGTRTREVGSRKVAVGPPL